MRVRPVDLRGASPQELTDLQQVRTASNPPHGGVRPAPDRALPGRRTACWLAYDGPRPVGALSLVLPAGSEDGFVRLDVTPTARRSGAARQLLTEAVRISWTLGREVLRSRCDDGGPGVAFAQAMGGTPGSTDELVEITPRREGSDAWIPIPAPPQETSNLMGAWAPDIVPAPDRVGLTAVAPDGGVSGVAGQDEDGSHLVVLAPDVESPVGYALAEAYAAMLGRPLPVWIPRRGARTPGARAGRTVWSLDVSVLARHIGMH